MCMNNYHAEKVIFEKFTAFLTEQIFNNSLYMYSIMVGSAYFVKSTPPRAFSISFQYFADMLQTY